MKKNKTTTAKKTSVKATNTPRVGVIMGSDSDLKVMDHAAQILQDFGVPYEIRIVSAHRTPKEMFDYAETAEVRGLEVLIAGAGGAAHLPGMVAAACLLPVIGVPVNVTSMDGLDALLSIVQMPKGVPVATVAVDNATNAALLAIRMLAIKDADLRAKLADFRDGQKEKVAEANRKLSKR